MDETQNRPDGEIGPAPEESRATKTDDESNTPWGYCHNPLADVEEGLTLSDEHRKMLRDAGITDEIIDARGYKTVGHDAWLSSQNFTKRQRSYVRHKAGLLIPQLGVDGARWGWQLRHFRPDTGEDSNWAKYYSPMGQRLHVDVPPGAGEYLRDPREPLWITEGTKKADAAWSRGILTVSILGVDCWRGSDEETGGKAALADWHGIALSGRKVVIAFDSDIARKAGIKRSADEFARWLESKGTDVHVLFLPDPERDLVTGLQDKLGLDDYLAQYGEADLEALLRPISRVRRDFSWQSAIVSHRPRNDLSDSDLGELVADQHLGRYLWQGKLGGWLRYDGRRWEVVPDPAVSETVRLALNAIYDERARQARADDDTDRLKALTCLLTASKLRNVMHIAKGRKTTTEDFDANPDLLNVRNGVVVLRDGTLRPHHPDLMMTKIVETDYVPDAMHPDWDQVLKALPDHDAADWVQVRFGQALTGHPVPDDRMLILNGGGENGKTTVLVGIQRAVGSDYAVPLPERVLLGRHGDHPTEMMELRGARLAVAEETPELAHLNVKRLKDLHGTDWITARYCGKDSAKFRPTHTVFLSTNYLPRVDESDHGTWRRLAMVPFPYTYHRTSDTIRTGLDRLSDPGLRERVKHGREQHEAILAWLVKGAVRWYEADQVMFPLPACVQEATDRWRASSDTMLRYITERLVFDGTRHVVGTELLEDYNEWLVANGHKAWSDQTFAARFSGHPEVQRHEVDKKIIRNTEAGVSRKPGLVGVSSTRQPSSKQFRGWVGLRFCSGDDEGSEEDADVQETAHDQG